MGEGVRETRNKYIYIYILQWEVISTKEKVREVGRASRYSCKQDGLGRAKI